MPSAWRSRRRHSSGTDRQELRRVSGTFDTRSADRHVQEHTERRLPRVRRIPQLSRREFVARTTATAVALSVPAWLPRVTYAQSASSRDVLVSIFLRGGADGMSLVAPWGERANYYALRPTIAIPPDSTRQRARRLLRLSAGDGVAPAGVSGRATAHRSRRPARPTRRGRTSTRSSSWKSASPAT